MYSILKRAVAVGFLPFILVTELAQAQEQDIGIHGVTLVPASYNSASNSDTEFRLIRVPVSKLSGFRLSLSGVLGWAALRGGAKEVWDMVDGVGFTPGISLGIGYDSRTFGVSVGYSGHSVRSADRDGGGIAVSGMLHWRPTNVYWRAWSPRLSLGYVRRVFGKITFDRADFPESVLEGGLDSLINNRGEAYTTGNGLRIAISAERRFRGNFSWQVMGGLDALFIQQIVIDGIGREIDSGEISYW